MQPPVLSVQPSRKTNGQIPIEHLCNPFERALVGGGKPDRCDKFMVLFVKALVQQIGMQRTVAEVKHQVVPDVRHTDLPHGGESAGQRALER